MKKKREFNLEDRLVDFAASILDLSEKLPGTFAGNHLSKQIIRSGTVPALLYGEAQGAESRADFIHKMKVALKELRETYVCSKIILKKEYVNSKDVLGCASDNNELISIFVKSIDTARRNMENG